MKNLGKIIVLLFTILLLSSFNVIAKESTTDQVATVYSIDDFKSKLTDSVINEETSISICYNGSLQDINYRDMLKTVIYDIMRTPGHDYEKNLISSWKYTYMPTSQGFTVSFTIQYIETYEQVKAVKDKVDEILAQIITSKMTDEEKEKKIHTYICNTVVYDDTYETYTAYDALFKGKTVCMGYSLLAYRMFTEAGLESRMVIGTALGGGHAWDMVKINKEWYQVDVTWDDPLYGTEQDISYSLYNLTNNQMRSYGHKWDDSVYPSCDTFYTMNN